MIDFIRFAPDDNLFFTVGKKLILFNSEDNQEKVLKELESKITGIYVEDNLVVLSDDSGFIHFGSYPTMALFSYQAYANKRVKAFKFFKEHQLLISISTEGYVSVWDVGFILDKVNDISGDINLGDRIQSLYSFEIEARLICLDAKIDIKKSKTGSEDVVKLRSASLDKRGDFVNKLLTKTARLTRIGSRGGRRGAQNLYKLMKFNHAQRILEIKSQMSNQ